MSAYRQEIAKVESTRLGYEDHGIFTCSLHVTYGDGLHQGIGQACLDDKPLEGPGEKRRGTAFGHEWIARILRACGVDCWEKLPGRTIFVLTNPEKTGFQKEVLGIENLPTEPGERFLFADLSPDFGKAQD